MKRGQAARIRFTNLLPNAHPLPVDTVISTDPTTATHQNKTAVHLHGGLIPWISDGGPFDWWTPGGQLRPRLQFPERPGRRPG